MTARIGWKRFIGGVGAGAALAYFLDARLGRRRRARARDKLDHWLHLARGQARRFLWDAGERARGLGYSISADFRPDAPAGHVLEQRVRAALGRCVSHPHAIRAEAHAGEITLTGPILAGEVDRLLDAVAKVRGVRLVHNRLETHASGDHVPGLQGGLPRTGGKPEFLQENWSPAARWAAGGLGAGLAAVWMRRGGVTGLLALPTGCALLLRAFFNRRMGVIFGLASEREAVDLEKTLHFHAPVDKVSRLWTDFRNFPRYMPHIKEVRDLGGGVLRWKAKVAGMPFLKWDTEITDFEPDAKIAWKSRPGSVLRNSGSIRFVPSEEGGTRVDIRISYSPPGGAAADALARLFGLDGKSSLDRDLMIMKNSLDRELAAAGAGVP